MYYIDSIEGYLEISIQLVIDIGDKMEKRIKLILLIIMSFFCINNKVIALEQINYLDITKMNSVLLANISNEIAAETNNSKEKYKVCLYHKDVDPIALNAALHVNGEKLQFDIYRAEANLGLTSEIRISYPVYNDDHSVSGKELLSETSKCPYRICEDKSENKAWIDDSCTEGLANYLYFDQTTEAAVSGISNQLAFIYNMNKKENIEYSTILSGECPSNVGVFKLLGIGYTYLKIAAPIALLLFASIDMAKAVASSDEGKIKKAQATCLKRFGAAAIVFLSFVVIQMFVEILSGGSELMNCISEILK